MFESLKNHPLVQDLKAAGDGFKKFNSDVSDELSKTVGRASERIRNAAKWAGEKMIEHFSPSEPPVPVEVESESESRSSPADFSSQQDV